MNRTQLEALQRNIAGFIREFLGCALWEKQKEIAQSVATHKKTLVQSANGTGKTHVAARIALAWLFTRPGSAVITTASSYRQVERLLWKEIRTAYNQAPIQLGGELAPKSPRLDIGDDWSAVGFSTDDPVNFQGYHSKGGNLIIIDEAAGVRNPEVWNAIEGCLVGEDDRLLALANPTEPSGQFFDMCRSGAGNVITVSAFDVPNVKEGRTVIPGLVTAEWVDARREEWGEDSPMYVSRVKGLYPDNADDCLIPLSWADAAVERWKGIDKWSGRPRFGVDVARSGPNATVIAKRYAEGIRDIEKLPKQSTMATAGHTKNRTNELDADQVRTDADGLGSGVHDRLRETIGEKAIGMRGGMNDRRLLKDERGKPLCFNNRSDWFWQVRQALDPKGDAPMAIPPDSALRNQLTGIKWRVNSKGLIQIESKDEMRKRGMMSPDEADAVAYAVAEWSRGVESLDLTIPVGMSIANEWDI